MSLIELGQQLLEAAQKGETEHIKFLMCNGAPFTTDWFGTTPLHLASQNGHANTAEVLIHAGITIDTKSKLNRTPLHMAAQYGHFEMVQLLLKSGANVNLRDMLNMTPLHWAVEGGKLEILDLLLKHGAWPTVRNKFEKTPLDLAIANFRSDMVNILKNAEQMQQIHEEELIIDDSSNSVFYQYNNNHNIYNRPGINNNLPYLINSSHRKFTYPNMKFHLYNSANPSKITTPAHNNSVRLNQASNVVGPNTVLGNTIKLPINGNYLVALNDKYKFKNQQTTNLANVNSGGNSLNHLNKSAINSQPIHQLQINNGVTNSSKYLVNNNYTSDPIYNSQFPVSQSVNDHTAGNNIVKNEFIDPEGSLSTGTQFADANFLHTSSSPHAFLQTLSDQYDKTALHNTLFPNQNLNQTTRDTNNYTLINNNAPNPKRIKLNEVMAQALQQNTNNVRSYKLNYGTKPDDKSNTKPQFILVLNSQASTTKSVNNASIVKAIGGGCGSNTNSKTSVNSNNYNPVQQNGPALQGGQLLNIQQINNLIKFGTTNNRNSGNNKNNAPSTNKCKSIVSSKVCPNTGENTKSNNNATNQPFTTVSSLPCYILTSTGKVLSDKEWSMKKEIAASTSPLLDKDTSIITDSRSFLYQFGESLASSYTAQSYHNQRQLPTPTTTTTPSQQTLSSNFADQDDGMSAQQIFNQLLNSTPDNYGLLNATAATIDSLLPSSDLIGCNINNDNHHLILSPHTEKALNFETKEALSSLNVLEDITLETIV